MVSTLLFEHVMNSHLLQKHEFSTLNIQCQFVNVSLKCLKRLPDFVIHMSSFRLNNGAKQSVVDVKDKELASKPMKSLALSHCWTSIKWVASGVIRFPLRFIESEGLESDMPRVATSVK